MEVQGTENPVENLENPAVSAEGVDNPAPSGEPAEGGEPAPVVAAPPPYQPNLSYKVRNQEKKFDDWLVPVIKDADTEKKVRELHEKAYGLEYVKADRENIQKEHHSLKQDVQQRLQPVFETAQQIVHFRDQGNLPAVFKLLGVQNQDVFKWALNFANMSPEARQQMEQNANTGLEAYGAQRQYQSAEHQAIQQSADFKVREFGMMSKYDPQVSAAVSDFDQQHGQGAFFEQVKRTGLYYYQTQGRDLSVEEAVGEVMKLFGRGQQAAPLSVVNGGAPSPAAQPNMVSTPQAPTPKPVIPGIQGSGASPVKRVVSSFADVRKRAEELRSQE